jgi:hypothetical protein
MLIKMMITIVSAFSGFSIFLCCYLFFIFIPVTNIIILTISRHGIMYERFQPYEKQAGISHIFVNV